MSGSTGPVDWDGLVLGPCQSVFGETAFWKSPRHPGQVQITGIFDKAFYALDPLGGEDGMAPVHISTTVPILGVQLSQFPVPPEQGDLVTVRGKIYRVREVRSDSHGAARLELNTAEDENDPLPGGAS